jgi:hypothetical protein
MARSSLNSRTLVVIHEQGRRALAAERQRALGIDDAVDVVDERQVLVQQDAAAQPGDHAAGVVHDVRNGQHGEGAVFDAAVAGRRVARRDERDADAVAQVRRHQREGLPVQDGELGAADALLALARRRELVGAGTDHLQEVQPQVRPGVREQAVQRRLVAGVQGPHQRVRAGDRIRAAADFGDHLVEVAVGHSQVAAHLGDQQPVVSRVAPQDQRRDQQRQHHQQRQQRHGHQLVAHRLLQPAQGKAQASAHSAQRRSSVRREMPSNCAARVLSPCTESSTAMMCCFSSVCRSVAGAADAGGRSGRG